jgi:outer membrane autotransporter protein
LRTGGIQAGYDHLFGKVRLGVSASYSDSTAHFANSLDYSRSRGGLGAFYGQYQGGWRNWYANLGLGYGVYTNDLKRILSFAAPALEAQGNSQTDLLLGFTEAGFDMLREGPLTLQPFAGVLLAEIMTSSFTEKGAEPYNLRFSGDTYRSRQSNVGARLILRDAVGSRWPYRLEVEASWRHEFANRDIPVNTAFAANPVFGFTSFGAPRAANTLLLESGGSLSLGRGVQITGRVAYSYDSCQSGVAVSAGLQKAW